MLPDQPGRPDQPSPGSVDVTPRRALAVGALFGALAGWLVVVTAGALDTTPPSVPWATPAGLILVAGLVGGLAWSTYQRIQVRRERTEPLRGVAFLVLGKASALGGAVVAGGYLAYALLFVTRWDAAGPRERVIGGGLAAIAGVGLMVAGLLLERACKVPRAPHDGSPKDPDDDFQADPRD